MDYNIEADGDLGVDKAEYGVHFSFKSVVLLLGTSSSLAKYNLQPPQIRQLTELKSGLREDLPLITSVDTVKAIINVTHL